MGKRRRPGDQGVGPGRCPARWGRGGLAHRRAVVEGGEGAGGSGWSRLLLQAWGAAASRGKAERCPLRVPSLLPMAGPGAVVSSVVVG